ncbi:MAG: pyrroline-5-carboxylate reductase [Rubricoccaceae bacterium]
MLQRHTIAVIGAGNIGRALLGGLLRGGHVRPEQLRATRRNPLALEELAARFAGVACGTDNAEAVRGADVVLVAVKPQNAAAVLASVREHLAPDTLVVSTLAGVTTDALAEALGQALPVVRAMPNTPALVDEGATALAPGRYAAEEHLATVRQMFEAVGLVEVVPEYLMDAVTGLSGSGPAYVYMVIEALTDAGVKQGLPRPTALRLAAQTVFGAAKLVLDTGKHPAILRDEVTTPGGTSIAAVAELEKHGLRTMLIDAVATATRRSGELSRLPT